MNQLKSTHSLAIVASIALLSGCGADGGTSLPAIKLSGPISSALAASDQVPLNSDGTVGIGATLASFPQAALNDFATRFPDMVAEEQYRIVNYDQGIIVSEVFGIEGENSTDTAEVEAQYNADGSFSLSSTSSDASELPVAVSDALSSLYPSMTIDESEQLTDSNGNINYQVELEDAAMEVELLFDSNGVLLQVAEEIDASQAPAVVVTNATQELPADGEIEYEKITDSVAGVITYEVEVERDIESVEITYSETGNVLSMTFEQAL